MKSKTFNKMSDREKEAVRTIFHDAADNDGYWYRMHEGKVIWRAPMNNGRQVPPHRSGGGHWVGG